MKTRRKVLHALLTAAPIALEMSISLAFWSAVLVALSHC